MILVPQISELGGTQLAWEREDLRLKKILGK